MSLHHLYPDDPGEKPEIATGTCHGGFVWRRTRDAIGEHPWAVSVVYPTEAAAVHAARVSLIISGEGK